MHHENIVTVIEELIDANLVLASGSSEVIPYCVVFEYVEGISVFRLQDAGKMTEELVHFIYK